jgi:integral membrane protein TerC family protein
MLSTGSRIGAASGISECRARSVRQVAVWIAVSLALGFWVLAMEGSNAAAEYYAAYFLEKSLSIDNIFVFVIIFSELHIPDQYQRRVLRFGILGALVFRQSCRSPPCCKGASSGGAREDG